ncbi:MAG TPA: hypothetical protein VKH44_08675, partial [Pirellulaceae bacterium]|nr:hypothetical protein [Pirellulaceae bacterium]
MTTAIEPSEAPEWGGLQRRALLVGIVCAALCALGGRFSPQAFLRSYLVAWNFWLGIALGSLVLVMLQHLTGGAWGVVLRRVLESGTRTLPLLAVLFVPLALGLHALYEWVDSDDPSLAEKRHYYLNVPFFLPRSAFYFAAWLLLMFFLNRWSSEEDRTQDPSLPRRFRLLSGPGLPLYGLTITFASIDWVMSLEPHWVSSIFGVMFGVGQVLSAFAFAVAVVILLARRPPLANVLLPSHMRDLGNLLLAFVMVWAYLSFSQFLLIWAGNLPEEVPWYLRRLQGGWQWFGLALVLFHFVLPFVLLLSADIKRDGRRLAVVACLVLVMRFVDLFWLIVPAGDDLDEGGLHLHWLDVPLGLLAVAG